MTEHQQQINCNITYIIVVTIFLIILFVIIDNYLCLSLENIQEKKNNESLHSPSLLIFVYL